MVSRTLTRVRVLLEQGDNFQALEIVLNQLPQSDYPEFFAELNDHEFEDLLRVADEDDAKKIYSNLDESGKARYTKLI